MLGSAVQVRPLLPSSKKAAQTGGLFCGGKVIASRLADPALFLLGTAQEGPARSSPPLATIYEEGRPNGRPFCGGKVIASRLADPALFCWGRRRRACPFKSAPCYHLQRRPPKRRPFCGGKVLPVSGLFAVLALMLVETVGGLRQGTLETWILRTFMTVDEQSHIPGLLIG